MFARDANLVVLGTLNLAKILRVRINLYELFIKTKPTAKKLYMLEVG